MTTSIGGVSLTTDSDSLGALTPTKGNVAAADGTNWNALPVGTDGKVLTADAASANGVKWDTPTGVTDHGALTGLADDDHTQYLLATGTRAATSLVVGDPGTEGSGIDINGVTYASSFKVSDIGGTNSAQTIFHRHSTTLEPLIVGARSNSNTSAHGTVTTGQNLFSIYAVGHTGSHYDLFGSTVFSVGTGTVSATSSPGKFTLLLTPDGSNTPASVLTIDSNKSANFTGDVGIGATPVGAFGAIDNGMLIKNSGAQVGIRLETTAASTGAMEIYAESGVCTLDGRGGPIRVTSATTELWRWAATAQISFGTTTTNVGGVSTSNTILTITGSAATYAGMLELGNSASNANDQALGRINFFDGSNINARIEGNRFTSTDSGYLTLQVKTAGGALTERVRVTPSAIGIGVTPKVWTTVSPIDMGSKAQLYAGASGGGFNYNTYYDGSWRYYDTGFATEIFQYGTNGEMWFGTAASGTAGNAYSMTYGMKLYNSGGLVLGSPTGGDKGAGSLNAVAVYDDNTLLTCYVPEAWLTGSLDFTYWDSPAVSPDLVVLHTDKDTGVTTEVSRTPRPHIGAHKFAARLGTDTDPLDIEKYANHLRTKGHLTSFPNKANWVPGEKPSGSWVQCLVEQDEIQAVHIIGLHDRLKALEAKFAAYVAAHP